MSNELTPFGFEGMQFRVIVRDGDPWPVGKDACDALGIKNSSQALARLDDDERDEVCITDPMGREQLTTVISEAGFYKLIARSSKPMAKAIMRWWTHEVLPSIRRTGSYAPPGTAVPLIDGVPIWLKGTLIAIGGGVIEAKALAVQASVEVKDLKHDAAKRLAETAEELKRINEELADNDKDLRILLDADLKSLKHQCAVEMQRRTGEKYGIQASKFWSEIKKKSGILCPVSVGNLNVHHYLELIGCAKDYATERAIPLLIQMHTGSEASGI